MDAWLTVDSIPATQTTRTITLPDSEDWLAILRGCLLLLTYESNYEQFGTLTPEEMADEWRTVFFNFLEEPPMLIAPGCVMMHVATGAPDGWLLCNGQAVSRTDYAALFAILGTYYGDGDGSTTFNLPNLAGRCVIGPDPDTPGMTSPGNAGGERNHVLTEAETGTHNHLQNSHNHLQNSHGHTQDSHNHTQNSHQHVQLGNAAFLAGTQFGVNNAVAANPLASSTNPATATNQATTATNQATTATNQTTTATNQAAGGGAAHNNMQPYLVLYYIIKT